MEANECTYVFCDVDFLAGLANLLDTIMTFVNVFFIF